MPWRRRSASATRHRNDRPSVRDEPLRWQARSAEAASKLPRRACAGGLYPPNRRRRPRTGGSLAREVVRNFRERRSRCDALRYSDIATQSGYPDRRKTLGSALLVARQFLESNSRRIQVPERTPAAGFNCQPATPANSVLKCSASVAKSSVLRGRAFMLSATASERFARNPPKRDRQRSPLPPAAVSAKPAASRARRHGRKLNLPGQAIPCSCFVRVHPAANPGPARLPG